MDLGPLHALQESKQSQLKGSQTHHNKIPLTAYTWLYWSAIFGDEDEKNRMIKTIQAFGENKSADDLDEIEETCKEPMSNKGEMCTRIDSERGKAVVSVNTTAEDIAPTGESGTTCNISLQDPDRTTTTTTQVPEKNPRLQCSSSSNSTHPISAGLSTVPDDHLEPFSHSNEPSRQAVLRSKKRTRPLPSKK